MSLTGKTNNLSALPKHIEIGRILAINVLTGGSGYTNGATATVTITGGGGSGATATALVTGGVVQSITMTAPGFGYTSTPTLSIPGAANATFLVSLQSNSYASNTGDTGASSKIVFVDDTQAALNTNKSKGLTSPGWWYYTEWVDSAGTPRSKAQLLWNITSTTAGGGSWATLSSVETVLSVSVAPANQTTVTGGATFSITAATTGGATVGYQWQRAPAATPTVFANVGGANASTLALTGRVSGNTGDVYRCLLSTTNGMAKRLVSAPAVLTFGT